MFLLNKLQTFLLLEINFFFPLTYSIIGLAGALLTIALYDNNENIYC